MMSSPLFRQTDGRCPFCNGEVNLIEGMVFDYTLDKDGYPNLLNTENYRISSYCQYCNRQLFPLPNGNGGYSIYPINLIHTINELDRIIDNTNNQRISVISNKLLNSTDENVNPFTNVRESLINTSEEVEDLIEEDIPF